ATATALDEVRALGIERQRFYELMRTDPAMSVKLMWSFIQVLNTRLRMTNSELLTSRETIDILRQNQKGGVIAELPNVDPGLQAVAALPVMVTDELIPNFLFADGETSGTDPLLRTDEPEEGPVDPSAPTLELPEVDEELRRTQPEMQLDPKALDEPALIETATDRPALRLAIDDDAADDEPVDEGADDDIEEDEDELRPRRTLELKSPLPAADDE
ncbi:MAG: hypothetical protein KC620_25890, partial [Myxococcales bacterium]|nr:hypothetical protein [Myxococcales bacterium]